MPQVSYTQEHLVSCWKTGTVRQCSTLIVVLYDSLTSRQQLCMASHQPAQHRSGFIDSFLSSLFDFHFPFASTVWQCLLRLTHISHVPLEALASVPLVFHQQISIPRRMSNVAALVGFHIAASEYCLNFVCFDVTVLFSSCPGNCVRFRAIVPVASIVLLSWSFLLLIHPLSGAIQTLSNLGVS